MVDCFSSIGAAILMVTVTQSSAGTVVTYSPSAVD